MSNDQNNSELDAKEDFAQGWPPAVAYFVFNENTLCYKRENDPRFGVLAGSVIRGGRSWLDGSFSEFASDVKRPATKADFETYRVQLPSDFVDQPAAPTTRAVPKAAIDVKGKRFEQSEARLVGSASSVRSRVIHQPAVIGEFPVFVDQSGSHQLFTWSRKLAAVEV